MNILGIFHGYPPYHNSGAEWMAKEVFDWLTTKGNICDVWASRYSGEPYPTNDNDSSLGSIFGGIIEPDISRYDVIITHLNNSGTAVNMGRKYRKPVVFISHSDQYYGWIGVRPKGVYIVYNAEWTKFYLPKYAKHPCYTLHPPVIKDNYLVKGRKKQEYITLINTNENKGGYIFADIARQMPKTKFLAVKGAYGYQYECFPSNVKVIDNTPDMKSVYRQTKILLVPSLKESYGRVALEAMLNGIPVIAHGTMGLREACGDAAVFIDSDNRTNINAWKAAINKVNTEYDDWSEKVKLHYNGIDQQKELEGFLSFLHNILDDKWNHNRWI